MNVWDFLHKLIWPCIIIAFLALGTINKTELIELFNTAIQACG